MNGTLAEKLTIIVVTYNSVTILPSFFQHLRCALRGEKCPIIVCDNASQDGVQKFLREHAPQVTVLSSNTNEGYGEALNRGILAATTPFVALMNPDVATRPGSFCELVGFLESISHAAGVSGVVKHLRNYSASFEMAHLFPQGNVAINLGYETLKTRLFFYSGLGTRFAHLPWAVSWTTVPAGDAIPVSRLNGCFGLYRRDALIDAGLFDPRFFLYFEEDDIARRLVMKGFSLYVTDRTVVVHLPGSGSTLSGSVATDRILLNSQYLYFKKHYGLFYAWLSFGFIWATISFVLVSQTIFRRPGRTRTRHLWKWHLDSLYCGGGAPLGTVPGGGKEGVDYNWSSSRLHRPDWLSNELSR